MYAHVLSLSQSLPEYNREITADWLQGTNVCFKKTAEEREQGSPGGKKKEWVHMPGAVDGEKGTTKRTIQIQTAVRAKAKEEQERRACKYRKACADYGNSKDPSVSAGESCKWYLSAQLQCKLKISFQPSFLQVQILSLINTG